jgi:hypothetical protein
MTFRESISSLYEETKKLQTGKEIISEDDVVKAFVILNFIKYENIADVFLGCASLNLLNTYIKQPNAKIDYTFRKHMDNFLKGIEDLDFTTKLKVFYDEKDNLITFVFWSFQFSFHCVRYNSVVQKLERGTIEWDGIRKQLCAETIFDFALSNNYISDRTLGGDSLSKMVDEESELYFEGGYRFIKGKLIKVRNNKKVIEKEDLYDKNYIRKKLIECQDRPVILTGRFKKVWNKHVTFTNIRPFLPGNNSLTICNHINLYRPDVEKVYNIKDFEKDKRYFIIGRCEEYPHSFRMGVCLDLTIKPSPLFRVRDIHMLPDDIYSICHRFDLNEFRSNKNRHVKL